MKTVVITGVSGGIGDAVATLFAGRGWRVLGVDCVAPAELGKGVEFTKVDLAIEDDVKGFFGDFNSRGHGIDALVNNAAVQICKPLLQTTTAEWDKIMSVNLRGAFLTMKYAHPLLRINGGAIVNVGSVHARATSVGIAAYGASKGGLESLTRAAALEFAADGIRVNGVHPGAIETAMLKNGLKRGHLTGGLTAGESLEQLGRKHPLARIGQPIEIAETIVFLADREQASFITGQFLVADGGALSRLCTE